MFVALSRFLAMTLLVALVVPAAWASSDGGKPVKPFTPEDILCRADAMIAARWQELAQDPGEGYENTFQPGQIVVTTVAVPATNAAPSLPVGTRMVILERLNYGKDYRATAPDLTGDRVLAVRSGAFYPTIPQQILHRDRIAALKFAFGAELDVILLRDHGVTYDGLNEMKIVPRNGIMCLSDPE